MKKYRFLSLFLLLVLSLSLTPASAAVPGQEDLNLFCSQAGLRDANHGEVLYDLN